MASVLNEAYFHDEAAAFGRLEAIVWPKGPVCPHCGSVGKFYALANVRTKPSKKNPEGVVRYGLKKCAACRGQFTARKNTVFEDSHVPLTLWFQAVYLMCSSKKGVSANQLHRTLGVTLQTAWFMGHRIREAMRSGDLSPMGGIVETGTVTGRLYALIEDGNGRLNVRIRPRDGGAYVTCTADGSIGRQLRTYFQDAVRVTGKGTWTRNDAGVWTCTLLRISSVHPVKNVPLREAINELRAIEITWPEDVLSQMDLIEESGGAA